MVSSSTGQKETREGGRKTNNYKTEILKQWYRRGMADYFGSTGENFILPKSE